MNRSGKIYFPSLFAVLSGHVRGAAQPSTPLDPRVAGPETGAIIKNNLVQSAVPLPRTYSTQRQTPIISTEPRVTSWILWRMATKDLPPEKDNRFVTVLRIPLDNATGQLGWHADWLSSACFPAH